MGDMADMAREQEWNDLADSQIQLQTKVYPSFIRWTQKSGIKILITNMSDNHLMNAILMIERRDNWRKQWHEPLLNELSSRS